MFSPGTFHERVPRDLKANLAWRKHVLTRADEDPSFRESLREACSQDILFYINTFVWQFNPKKKGRASVAPFISWPFQDRAFVGRDPKRPGILWCIENDEDLIIEKSRDMGASWICLLAFEWLWHFHPYCKFLAISRNEEMVDKRGEPKSLFWKIDHVHQHLPHWLMPKGWSEKLHRKSMMFVNPENGSVLAGEATTGKAGVGDRCTAIFIDEFSQIEEDKEVRHRTADTTNCRIFNGTHVGKGTEFYKLTVKPGMKKLVMHWSEHPDKGGGAYKWDPEQAKVVPSDPKYRYPDDFAPVCDGKPSGGPFPGLRSPWYDRECIRRGVEREIAMDLDIDPVASESIFFDALQVNQLKSEACPPFWRGELLHDKESGKPQDLLQVADGALKLWLIPPSASAVPDAPYVAGADISWGTGATPSCFSLANAETGEKVLEFVTARLKPEMFARYCVALCRLFRDEAGDGALFAWEAAGPGLQFGQTVIELGYRRVYYRTDEFDLDRKVSQKPGWYPAPSHKLTLLADYRAALLKRDYVNRSEQALDETLMFKYGSRGEIVHAEEASEDDPAGARVNHADRVIADALCVKMMNELGANRLGVRKRPGDGGPPPLNSLAWRRELCERRAAEAKRWI